MSAEKKIGEYSVISKLGEGAMGVVYKAEAEGVDGVVAIKVISPEISGDREFVQRFLREMQVVSTLDHPNIVKAVDYGVDIAENIYFVALEFVEGKSLKDYLQQKKRLPLKESLEITQRIARGLGYAYQHGIVHRDIKPDNILMGKEHTIKITDFGLVKSQSQSSITQTGTILGTPFYLAPEQAFADKEIDIRADIYSLGITFYHMLAGRPPFVFENPMKVITAHCYTELPDINDFVSGIPSPIVELLGKMTEKERDNRFASPQQVIEAIEGFLANGDVSFSSTPQEAANVDDDMDYEEAPTRVFQGEVSPPEGEDLPPDKKETRKVDPKRLQSSKQKEPQPASDNSYKMVALVVALVMTVLVIVVVALVMQKFL